ncbi:transcriptional regulator PpsR [Tropicimonas sp. S265A]|uniref:transcriptional regulator PpsR n=1 Tax=Tropicimonas sp. S265A TaxID=3415134 RepID=UPI003C7E9F70
MNTRERDFWDDGSAPRIDPEQFNEIVATAADLAIVLDLKGTIQSLVVNPLNPTIGRLDHWEKRNIRDFLAEDSLPKLEKQLAAYSKGEVPASDSIEVNHFDNANWEFPIRYTLHRTGDKDMILMLGRDLRPVAELQHRLVKAQLALEKDYETHRDFQTRYRVIMDTTRDALVLVDAASGRINDLNAAAGGVLGAEPDALAGSQFGNEIEGIKRGELLDQLSASVSAETSAPVTVKIRRTGKEIAIHPRLFRAGGEKTFLCRLEGPETPEVFAEELAEVLTILYREGADAIVFTDRTGTIRSANEAFLNLTEVGQLSDIKGKSFADYLSRGSVDLKVLLDNAARNGTMPVYSTRLDSAYGSKISVEISATHVEARTNGGFAFVVRDASRMDVVRDAPVTSGPVSNEAMQNVMGLVGSAPLKDIVSATTDVVEKMCIETAVDLTRNNRVAAAEMLGLSRQSLYVKLRKYGLLNKAGED